MWFIYSPLNYNHETEWHITQQTVQIAIRYNGISFLTHLAGCPGVNTEYILSVTAWNVRTTLQTYIFPKDTQDSQGVFICRIMIVISQLNVYNYSYLLELVLNSRFPSKRNRVKVFLLEWAYIKHVTGPPSIIPIQCPYSPYDLYIPWIHFLYMAIYIDRIRSFVLGIINTTWISCHGWPSDLLWIGLTRLFLLSISTVLQLWGTGWWRSEFWGDKCTP